MNYSHYCSQCCLQCRRHFSAILMVKATSYQNIEIAFKLRAERTIEWGRSKEEKTKDYLQCMLNSVAG